MNLYDIRKNLINEIIGQREKLREHARVGNRLYINELIDGITFLEKELEKVEDDIWREQKREILEELLF